MTDSNSPDQDPPVDPDASKDGLTDSQESSNNGIDETIQWDMASDQSTTEIPAPEQSSRVVAGGSDAESLENDPTLETADEDTLASAAQPFGMGSESDEDEQTVANVEATIDMNTIQLRPPSHQTHLDSQSKDPQTDASSDDAPKSIMQSADVSQTIDPRALSKEDAAFWGSAAIGASKANKAEQSKLRPAVERSFAESKLQIRERDLAIPTRDADSPSDYRLVRLLGRGGMGNVYVARQASLDRMIAVKVIKPLSRNKRKTLQESGRLDEVQYERRQQFLSEAVVTGDLDHPNIVPIHDIAVAADNTLFYAMKRVVGEPWLKSIDQTPRDENLEILLKVCDAIAFAHTRGVIHRDIKPENIMLGGFGEVLVMDWGLALAKPNFEKRDSITSNAGLGGTPAFMAPEMALGPVESIGIHSDIYLLGATLFYIVVGHAPHKAENVSQCIRAVASNTIQDTPPEHQGELLDIALRAMATAPSDRYESVKDFQQAIRSYRSHSESIALATSAAKEYDRAVKTSKYESYSRASHGYEQAIALWDENQDAIDGLAKCKIAHAIAAYENGDYDLGLSLLDPSDSDHVPLIEKLNAGLDLRRQRASRLKLFRGLAVASLLVILVGGSLAMYLIDAKRREADQQRQRAVNNEAETNLQKLKVEQQKEDLTKNNIELAKQKEQISEARDLADTNAATANKNATVARAAEAFAKEKQAEAEAAETKAKASAITAINEKAKADKSAQEARDALQVAKYESYVSRIGLAKARIDGNEFDGAREILTSIRESDDDFDPAWEWRYLSQQANQSDAAFRLPAGVLDTAQARHREFAVVVCNDGSVHRQNLTGTTKVPWSRKTDEASCVAIDFDEEQIAIGSQRGGLTIVDPRDGKTIQRLGGHESKITDAVFTQDGDLLTSSADRTISLWDVDTATRKSQCWHIGPVVALSAQPSTNDASLLVIAAVSDDQSGQVAGWRLRGDQFDRLGEYLLHEDPVTSVVLRDDGELAASADSRGNVHLWNPGSLQQTDFEGALKNAISAVENSDTRSTRLVATRSAQQRNLASWKAHPDSVGTMTFDDLGNLLTGSDDYTIRAWDTNDQSLQYSLRGHGGWVRSLSTDSKSHIATGESFLLSGSVDGTLRRWSRPATKLASTSSATPKPSSTQQPNREQRLHQDEILAARFDSAGERVISASRDHTARILGIDPITMAFRELARIHTGDESSDELSEGTEFLAMSAAIDESGGRLFVGSADSTIRIWDINSGTELGTLPGTGLNSSFSLSRDGNRLLSGSSSADAKAILWNVEPQISSPVVLHRFNGHDQAVTAFATSSDGRVVVTGDKAGLCFVWNGITGQQMGRPLASFRGYRINDMSIPRDDQSLWVASDSGQLTEIDLKTRLSKREFDHRGFVTSVSLAPQNDRVVTISSETTGKAFVTRATLWNLSNGNQRVLDQVEAPLDPDGQVGNQSRINSVRFGTDGRRVLVCLQGKGGRSGRVSVHGLASDAPKSFDLPMRIGAPETGLLSGSNQLFTLNGEAAFRWSIDQMIHEKSYRPHAAVTNACFSDDGRLAATASRSVRLWNTDTGEAIDKLETPHRGEISSLDFASVSQADSYRFATAGTDGAARQWIWRADGGGFGLEREIGIDGGQARIVRFTPDGKHLMLAGTGGPIEIWPVDADSPINRLDLGSQSEVTCAAFSKDGRYLAVGTDDKTAALFDLRSESKLPISQFSGHADRIESICVLQDNSEKLRVLTASRDKTARVWDPKQKDGRELITLRRHTQGVTAIDCTPDGNLVMTAARDGRVLLWPSSEKQ